MPNRSESRKRYTKAQRRRLLAAYRKSDLSQREFAARNGISVSSLKNWLKEPPGSDSGRASPPFSLVELPQGLCAGASSARLVYKVRFAGGAELEIPPGCVSQEVEKLCRILHVL